MRTNRGWGLAAVIAVALAHASTAHAQGQSTTDQGRTPNGRPFQQIQTQIDGINQELSAVNQQIDALQAQILTVESTLQAQIDTIFGRLGDLQGQVDDLQRQIDAVGGGLAALEKRVTENEAAIHALQEAVAGLQAALGTAQAAIAQNTGGIELLQRQVANIERLIELHTSQIAGLEEQNREVSLFLANMTNATCQSGEAISDIGPKGIVQCTRVAGDLSTVTVLTWSYLSTGANYLRYSNCPSGYQLTGAGFWLPSMADYIQYVYWVGYSQKAVNLTLTYVWPWPAPQQWQGIPDYVYEPIPYYDYLVFDPLSVNASASYYGTAYVNVQYRPAHQSFTPYAYVYSNCGRVQ